MLKKYDLTLDLIHCLSSIYSENIEVSTSIFSDILNIRTNKSEFIRPSSYALKQIDLSLVNVRFNKTARSIIVNNTAGPSLC